MIFFKDHNKVFYPLIYNKASSKYVVSPLTAVKRYDPSSL
jgi:hypothetical protein